MASIFMRILVFLVEVLVFILIMELGVLDQGTKSWRASEELRPMIHRNPEQGKHRIVIIGAGPTALGAAKRLYDLKQEIGNHTVITILEQLDKPGGLASSTRDDNGFLWDVGGHVVFSHYTYFDRALTWAVKGWNYRRRASSAFMKGSDGVRRFIPYPVQNNIHTMDEGHQQKCLKGLEEITRNPISRKPNNFDEWLLQKFGGGLAEVFMRRYNRKVWTVDPTEMNSVWVGERVAVPDIEEIKTKIRETEDVSLARDSEWGPNRFFRYPKYNGTGGIWQAVADLLPRDWFKFHEKVTGIDVDKKNIIVEVGQDVKSRQTLGYDTLISTVPLDVFTGFLQSGDSSMKQMQELASQLVYTHTHVVGLGLLGQLPKTLADKSWVYFPDSDSPFYRITMFSNYSDDHVPDPRVYSSLMCEIAEPEDSSDPVYWSRDNLVEETIQALANYGFITADMVVSRYYHRFDHGYPVPSLKRDTILNTVQPWLESKEIYSRGRFGGWRYEAGNQDHSFMQGVEVVDRIVRGIPELTYPDPNLANSKKNADRIIPLDYEIVIAHHNENLDWIEPLANHTLIYHLGSELGPPSQVYAWDRLQDVGRGRHAYLYHIITNYDQLANVTVFARGGNADGRCFENPLELVSSAYQGIPCKRETKLHNQWGHVNFPQRYLDQVKNMGIPMYRADETLGQMYKNLFGQQPPLDGIPHCRGGCFGATKDMIRRRPLDFYKKATSYVDKYPNQEESHYIDKLWYHMFT